MRWERKISIPSVSIIFIFEEKKECVRLKKGKKKISIYLNFLLLKRSRRFHFREFIDIRIFVIERKREVSSSRHFRSNPKGKRNYLFTEHARVFTRGWRRSIRRFLQLEPSSTLTLPSRGPVTESRCKLVRSSLQFN